jgi:hypothetical protein
LQRSVRRQLSEQPQVAALRSGHRATHASSVSHPLGGASAAIVLQSRSHTTHAAVSREAHVARSSQGLAPQPHSAHTAHNDHSESAHAARFARAHRVPRGVDREGRRRVITTANSPTPTTSSSTRMPG